MSIWSAVDIELLIAAYDYRTHVQFLLAQEVPSDSWGIGVLDPDERARFDEAWRAFLVTQGLIAPGWLSEYGGGLDRHHARAAAQRGRRVSGPLPSSRSGQHRPGRDAARLPVRDPGHGCRLRPEP